MAERLNLTFYEAVKQLWGRRDHKTALKPKGSLVAEESIWKHKKGTHFTDVLCDRAEVWHLWGAGLFEVRPDSRRPQAKLLSWSVQLQPADSGLFSHLFTLSCLQHFGTSLEVNTRPVQNKSRHTVNEEMKSKCCSFLTLCRLFAQTDSRFGISGMCFSSPPRMDCLDTLYSQARLEPVDPSAGDVWSLKVWLSSATSMLIGSGCWELFLCR